MQRLEPSTIKPVDTVALFREICDIIVRPGMGGPHLKMTPDEARRSLNETLEQLQGLKDKVKQLEDEERDHQVNFQLLVEVEPGCRTPSAIRSDIGQSVGPLVCCIV